MSYRTISWHIRTIKSINKPVVPWLFGKFKNVQSICRDERDNLGLFHLSCRATLSVWRWKRTAKTGGLQWHIVQVCPRLSKSRARWPKTMGRIEPDTDCKDSLVHFVLLWSQWAVELMEIDETIRNVTKLMHLGRCIIFDLSKGEDKGLPRSQLCRLHHRPFFICPFFPQKKSHNLNTSQHFLRCLWKMPCLPWTIKPEGAKRIESLQALSAVAEANQNCRPGARFPSRSCKATKKIVLSENCKILLARART